MAARRSKLPPVWEAIDYAARGIDKTAELEVKYINSFKGRGVFAKAPFQKGDFVVEYRGALISSEESQRRRSIYHARCSVFMIDFYCRKKAWCVDAAQEDGSLGRLVNDDLYHPNCKMKKVITDGKPHLVLFALRDIAAGDEIAYEYRGKYCPWRKPIKVYGDNIVYGRGLQPISGIGWTRTSSSNGNIMTLSFVSEVDLAEEEPDSAPQRGGPKAERRRILVTLT